MPIPNHCELQFVIADLILAVIVCKRHAISHPSEPWPASYLDELSSRFFVKVYEYGTGTVLVLVPVSAAISTSVRDLILIKM